LALVALGAMAGLAGTAPSTQAAPTTQSFNCDRASECSNAFFPLETAGTFTKLFSYTVRSGGRGSEREFAVEGPNDAPISPQGQATQSAWSNGPSNHSFAFTYVPTTPSATVRLSNPPTGVSFTPGLVTSSSVPGSASGINAIALRASTDADGQGREASLRNLTLNAGGTSFVLTDLVGDGNAEYNLIVLDSLANGFELVGDADFNPNGAFRSTVAYQLKVGTFSGSEPFTEVPVPATLALLGLGLGLLGLGTSACATRRRGPIFG
jgi:hypothetical protein